ncbi:MAG: hypothetical protein PHZ00_05340 [Candidatus Peribacteraceae bacterium]|nr:hypothetical protein [Candidatus Peribacteraceae bacterium]
MTTRTIGIKEFRQNLTKLSKKAKKEKICYIVMNHQEPMGRFEPIDEDELIIEKFWTEIQEGLDDVKHGRVYTLDEVMKSIHQRKKK